VSGRLAALAARLTVGQKAALTVLAGLLVLALAFAATALLLPPRAALALWAAAVALLAAAVLLLPLRAAALVARPDPAPDYPAALARFGRAAACPTPLNPLCTPVLMTHGQRTAKAVVLLHGISSCPRAFVDFAPLLHARGHTVLATRMPQNGYADRATDALRLLTAEELCRWGDEAVDIAAGLGDEVVVLGISAGGTVAAWIGQNRPEVARAVLVAPMFGLSNFGPAINAALMRLTLLVPNISIWKDPLLRGRYQGMPHAYKRQSTRATGEILRLAQATLAQARFARARAGAGVLVTNANDTAIDNGLAVAFADAWQARGLTVERFEFPKADGLGHEIIDPLEPGADPALTYPVLIGLVEGEAAGFASTPRTASATSRTVTSMNDPPDLGDGSR
jgi:carboxylesterase